MFLTGVLYLLFEDAILANSSVSSHSGNSKSLGSRVIMGMQVGMVLLALIVTRSSVSSLQAREGLPFGNQVVGWFVLGELIPIPLADAAHMLTAVQWPRSHCPSSTDCTPTVIISTA